MVRQISKTGSILMAGRHSFRKAALSSSLRHPFSDRSSIVSTSTDPRRLRGSSDISLRRSEVDTRNRARNRARYHNLTTPTAQTHPNPVRTGSKECQMALKPAHSPEDHPVRRATNSCACRPSRATKPVWHLNESSSTSPAVSTACSTRTTFTTCEPGEGKPKSACFRSHRSSMSGRSARSRRCSSPSDSSGSIANTPSTSPTFGSFACKPTEETGCSSSNRRCTP
jgi:hypothetical protein